jgi:small-conductance mechanosensitive channel
MIKEILYRTFYGNTVFDYLISTGIFLASLLVIFAIKKLFITRLRALAQKTTSEIDDFLVDLIDKRIVPFFYLGSFYFSVQGLKMAQSIQKIFTVSISILLTILVVLAVTSLAYFILERHWAAREKDSSRKNAFKGLLTGVRVLIWLVAAIMLLDNLGVNISTLVTGLGIGGVAIALASQAILGDLFSYFTIMFDRPFEIGDFIMIGDQSGTVEHIGLKSTRLRSISGEELVMCNKDLTGSRIRNYKRMQNRRIVFTIGLTYDTPLEKLKEAPLQIKSIIESIPLTKFDRSHFFSFGDFSLNVETVYFVTSPDYNKYMDIQQEINFRIKESFESMGMGFAFPTQIVHVSAQAPSVNKGPKDLISA